MGRERTARPHARENHGEPQVKGFDSRTDSKGSKNRHIVCRFENDADGTTLPILELSWTIVGLRIITTGRDPSDDDGHILRSCQRDLLGRAGCSQESTRGAV
jgi:hypothetical protein